MRLGWVHRVLAVVAAVVCLGVGPGGARMPTLRAPEASHLREAVLHRVIDGDSVEVFMDGRVQRLELSGVDAPEIREGLGAQRGAEESRSLLGLLAGGEPLMVMLDPRRSRDAAGRLRGYLYRAPELTLLNIELVRLGLAKHPHDPAGWNEAVFVWAQGQARSAGKGLWDPAFGVVEEPAVVAGGVEPVTDGGAVVSDAPESAGGGVGDGARGDDDGDQDDGDRGGEPAVSDVVFVTRSGTKYHREGCRHASKTGEAVSRASLDPSLEACKVCDPDGEG